MANKLDISVLIATRNRAEMLEATLSRFNQLKVGTLRWEIIIIDNGSTDATGEVLEKATDSLPLVHFFEPVPGKNRALNRALEIATGELLVFTDDDIFPEANWLAELHAATGHWPQDFVFGGPIEPLFPESTPDWIRDPDRCDPSIAFGRFKLDLPEGPMLQRPFGGNLAIARSLFLKYRYNEKIGPSGTNYAQGNESELLGRLQQAEYRFIHVPSAKVEHVIRSDQVTLKWLFGRYYRYGRGRARQLYKRRKKQWWSSGWYRIQFFVRWLHYLSALFSQDYQRFLKSKRYFHYRGYLHETRVLAGEERETRRQAGSVVGSDR